MGVVVTYIVMVYSFGSGSTKLKEKSSFRWEEMKEYKTEGNWHIEKQPKLEELTN